MKDVYDGKFPVFEGVICKNDDFMVKVKTKKFYEKLLESRSGMAFEE